MRKRIRILLFAALVAAIVVPVGFALSLPSGEHTASASYGVTPISQISSTRIPLPTSSTTGTTAVSALPRVPEGAKLLAIGTALFGLAAAMRRSRDRER